jgi:putative membrane protein
MSLVHSSYRSTIAGVLALGFAACGGGDASNEELGQDSPPLPGDTAVTTTTEPGQLTDNDVAAILAASDTAEIAPSELAENNAQDAQVTQFAAMMVRDHGMLSDSMRALTQANGITPGDNMISEQLRAQTQATVQSLQGLNGAAFDSAYVAAMVQSHEAALNAIDSQLLGATQNPQLRMALEQRVRPAVAAHLEQIQQIQSTLNSR